VSKMSLKRAKVDRKEILKALKENRAEHHIKE
jgi:hypothetical protein